MQEDLGDELAAHLIEDGGWDSLAVHNPIRWMVLQPRQAKAAP